MTQLAPAAPSASNGPAHPGLRNAALRFAVFAAVVATAVAAFAFTPLRQYLSREHLLALMDSLRAAWWSPAVLLAMYAVLSPLGAPMTPLMICGAVLFGATRGSIYNVIGFYIGAFLSYFFARSMGRELVVRLAGKRLKKVERIIARRGFWALVGVRFLPLPFPLTNFGAALAGVKPGTFILSSLLGLPLPCVLYTVLWHQVASAAEGHGGGAKKSLSVAIVVLVVLSVLPAAIATWRRVRRYRQIVEQRGER